MTAPQGMFDGFEAYRTPADRDYQRVLRHGLVVLDTNVLLDLYRMNGRVREDMLTVLKTIAERLWAPHQVLVEFWRNRQSEELITYHDKKASTAAEILKSSINRSRSALDEWARNVHIGDNTDIVSPMYEKLDGAEKLYQDIEERLERQAAKDRVPGIRNTHTDPVINALEQLLDQRVGVPYSPQRHAQEVQRAKERADQQIPPGYKDFESGKKEDEEAAGDYLVWRQIMDAAQSHEKDILFVTRDLKEDWWRKASTKAVRLPRIELVNELRDLTGLRLFMVEPSTLMQQVSNVFQLEKQVDRNSVDALRHLEAVEADADALRHAATRSRFRLAKVPGGRSNDYVETLWLMAQLVEENPHLKTCLKKFMEFFTSVTLEPEARKRLMNLVSLGLSVVRGEQILLTSHGRKFVESRDAQLLRRLFMDRILGAQEARQMLAEGASVAEVKQLLDEQPDLDLSVTQSELLLRWMGKLDLLPA
ncbi:PIN domain-containing protein [Streptomyces rugosispiralis]|uniref:PIN domain-containing protein n=1 Tax=Streptomyces rugosispiralis TaxID=2967341 RepID=A0ABT1VCM6_9ACTN|nr:PIN domain-containing protein [Streptomyces rugosispiralis]MCQ8195159.1 PIN domain-containing protein [Streptomyces rugosispiralis]